MKNQIIFLTFSLTILCACSVGRGAEADLPEGFRSGEFQWKVAGPVVEPQSRDGFEWYSIKDPSVVFYQGKWHLFCTLRGKQRSHTVEYLTFRDWKDANKAERHILPIHPGYFCAPQVFYFSPQKKWYLIFQAEDESWEPKYQPAFSTNKNVADWKSWSTPKPLFGYKPKNFKRWIDFWIICDETKAYLFFTSLNGKMWRAETKLSDFPHDWSQPVVALQGDVFEASHTYKLKGREKYLTLIEAVRGDGWRYYKAYLADRLDGEWKELAATREKPFASKKNVEQTAGHWRNSISHGELLRSGYDEKLEVDPTNPRFLFQGVTKKEKDWKNYGEIPWRLGILEAVNTSVRAQVEEIPGRWSIEKAKQWYQQQPWLVGCNYLPATAINQLEMWQADTFDLDTIDKELSWAEDLGFNMLRVYLHDLVWGQDAKGLYERMDQFLNLCDRHGMRVLFVFFDDCHCPDPVAGKQPPCLKGVHNSGWAMSPGTELVIRYHDGKATEAEKKRLQGYVQETMRQFKDDERVLAWELYNEPGRSAGGKSVPLLMDAWKWAREVNPSQPVCSSAEGSAGQIYIDIARANSDVISFHSYSVKTLEEAIKTYQQIGRPAMCTEYMARPGMPIQKALPILKKYGVAAINWGFVSGKTGTVWGWKTKKGKNLHELRKQKENILQPGEAFPEPKIWFHDIYRIDGTPYSKEEIIFIKEMTGKKRKE